MTVGVALVAGAGLFVAGGVIALAAISAWRGTDPSVGDISPRTFCIRFAGLFGGLGAIVGVGAVAGALVGGVTPETIGIYGNPVGSVALGITAGPVLLGAQLCLVRLLEAVGFSFPSVTRSIAPETVRGLGWCTVGLGVQASAEELIFRGALVGALAVLLSVSLWSLVVPAALLFGLAHAGRGSGSVISTTIAGIGFGTVFVLGGLVAAVLAHIVNNVLWVTYVGLLSDVETATTSQEETNSLSPSVRSGDR